MNKKLIVAIPVRLSSKRLPRKHMQMANGRTLLSWLVQRQKHFLSVHQNPSEIAIVTAEEAINEELRAFAKNEGVHVFFGHPTNIPQRMFDAANAFGAEGVVAVDGDDVCCSVQAVNAVTGLLNAGFPLVSTSGLPFGMNVAGFLSSELKACLQVHSKNLLETGWGRIFKNSKRYVVNFPKLESEHFEKLRFTLDYAEDFTFFNAIAQHFGESLLRTGDEAIIRYCLEKEIFQHNVSVQEKYLESFNREMNAEIDQH